MKYIRTKDEVREFDERFNLEHYRNCGFSDEDIVRKFIRNGNKIADTIEELIQDDDLALFFELKVYCDDYYYEYTIKNALMSVRDAKKITGGDDPYGHFKIKDIKELYIKDKHGNYIKIAERKDDKGELELL